MPRKPHPDRLIPEINFTEESGLGVLLNGNRLVVTQRQVIEATRTGKGPMPTLTFKDGKHRRSVGQSSLARKARGQEIVRWPLDSLEDGEYELISHFRLLEGEIWRTLYGEMHLRVRHGCLTALVLAPGPLDTLGAVDLTAATRRLADDAEE